MTLRIIGLVVLLIAAFVQPAAAHTRSQSFSSWTADGAVLTGVYEVDAYRVTQLTEQPQSLANLLKSHLSETVTLSQNGVPCTASDMRPLRAPAGTLRMELRFECAAPFPTASSTLTVNAFFDVSLSHAHFVRIKADTGGVIETILTNARRNVSLDGTAGNGHVSTFSFLSLGFTHVLSGVDHLAFLLALCLLSGNIWRIVWAVTGFTVGHSMTLALVVLGLLKPDIAAVEALIGFTVAWAAADALAVRNLTRKALGYAGAAMLALVPVLAALFGLPSLSVLLFAGLGIFAAAMSAIPSSLSRVIAPAIAIIFGLAHGAGFAGPLLELDIPPGEIFWTLLLFNVGVEAGQLTALAAFAGLWWLAAHFKLKPPPHAVEVTASLLFALGCFWFVSRALV